MPKTNSKIETFSKKRIDSNKTEKIIPAVVKIANEAQTRSRFFEIFSKVFLALNKCEILFHPKINPKIDKTEARENFINKLISDNSVYLEAKDKVS